MITILNRLELHNIKEQMDEGRPTLPTFTNFFNSEEVPPTSLLPTLGFITMVERVSCALRLDGDTWGGRHAKDFGCGVKREDLVLIGGIWGWWRSRMRAQ